MTVPLGFIMEQTMQPAPPSYVPMYMSAYSDTMTFFQRVHNFVWKFLTKVIGDFHIKGIALHLEVPNRIKNTCTVLFYI